VAGGGGNALNTMMRPASRAWTSWPPTPTARLLETNQAPTKIQIGKNLTRDSVQGPTPTSVCAAALEDASRIADVVGGADMVFVTAGMGGGTVPARRP